MKKLIAIISVMAALTAAVTSCEKDVIVGTNDGDGLYLNKVELTLVKGNSETLVATVTPKGAASLTWDSEEDAVATVDANGLVTAVGAGETRITATAGSMTVECLVKVQSPVTSLTLDKTEVYIYKGEDAEVTASVGPEDVNIPYTYTWISSDKSVFTVTADAENPGKAVIHGVNGGYGTLYVQAGDVTASIPVTIDVDLAGLVIEGVPTDKVYVDDTFQLVVKKDPIDAIDELSPVWSSSDESVLKVDQTGLVSAVGQGTAVITVESNGFTASVEISVNVMVTVSFYPTSLTYQVDDNLTLFMSLRYSPSSYYMYVYPGDAIRFSLTPGLKLVEIKVETYYNSYPFEVDVDSGTYDSTTFTWTGEANEVLFTSTYSSITYVTGITVTYKN